jgi:hypothetical protein
LDALLHFARDSQITCHFIDSCGTAIDYREQRLREAKLEPFDRKPPESAGAENFYTTGRENIFKKV